jgi:hypothetical protein
MASSSRASSRNGLPYLIGVGQGAGETPASGGFGAVAVGGVGMRLSGRRERTTLSAGASLATRRRCRSLHAGRAIGCAGAGISPGASEIAIYDYIGRRPPLLDPLR